MRYLIILAIFAASCSKSTTQALVDNSVSVTVKDFYKVAAGSNESVAFEIRVNAPAGSVKELDLLRGDVLVDQIENPVTGNYTLHDHIIGYYPTYSEKIFYHFKLVMADNSVKYEPEFQVY